jgi:hypothetical protein
MSPENNDVSQDNNKNLSTESIKSGDTGDNGVISPMPMATEEDNERIGFREPLYYCKQHPRVQNIHLEEIEHHMQYSKEHIENRK